MSGIKKFLYGVFFFAAAFMMVYGVIALITKQQYRNNDVAFQLDSNQAFFSATGEFYYGEQAIADETPTSEFSISYTQDDYMSGKNSVAKKWDIGETEFIFGEDDPSQNKTILKYVIKITNPVRDKDLFDEDKTLGVKVRGVALNPAGRFLTEIVYQTDEAAAKTVFSNDPANTVNSKYNNETNKVNVTDAEPVSAGSTLTVTITFTLNTKTYPFNFENNMIFELSVID